jgi:hypothetical protein
MSYRNGFVIALLVCGATLVACGGGGGGGVAPGGGSTPSGGHTTPPAGGTVTLPPASPAAPSQVSVNSNPAGLSVSVDGNTAGTTPATPAAGYGAHTIVVTPHTTASPYTIAIANIGNGPIAVYYNQTADSSGTITGGIATSSIAVRRAPQTVSSLLPRRSAAAGNGPAFAPATIAVRYDTARFGNGRTFEAVESAHGITRAQNLVQAGTLVTRVLTLAPGSDPDAALSSLRAETGVVEASRVGLRYPATSSSGTFYPNDTYFEATNDGADGDQWYLWIVDAEDAWGYGQGRAPIAVIDTGYDPLQTEVAGLVTFSETIVNLTATPNAATDTNGHGTFLSSVAGAQTNNGAGFAGMAYNAPLQEYKIFADGGTSAQTTDEAAAIRAAVSNGAKVILLALQSNPANGPDPVERDAVAYAIASGITVVAASGDDDGTALDYPAAYPGVISVGASIVNDSGTAGVVNGQGNSEAVAAYSNAGAGLGLVAPGGQGTSGDSDLLHWIEGAYTTQPYAGLPACAAGTAVANCRILFTGTSPAAAAVAGTAALMLTVNANLTPGQVAQLLEASADDIKDPKEGHGRLNAQRAVALAAGDPAPQPALPLPRAVQFVAFAYTNSGAALPVAPAIVDTTFKTGVAVNQNGTFRIADVNAASLPTGVTTYKIAIWLSLAGDGKVHPGDYFTSVSCSINSSCSSSLAALTATKLAAGATTLP